MNKLPKFKVRPRELTAYEKSQYGDDDKGKPRTHALVRKPPHEGGQYLANDGEIVTRSTYWLRRVKSKDCIDTPTEKVVTKESKQPKTKPSEQPKKTSKE